jgi:hypothetical protein
MQKMKRLVYLSLIFHSRLLIVKMLSILKQLCEQEGTQPPNKVRTNMALLTRQ